jgi:tetratricopeptide (TPR) repeat protein
MPDRRRILILSGCLIGAAAAIYLGSEMASTQPSTQPVKPPQGIEADRRHEEIALTEALKKKPDHAPVLMRLAQISAETGDMEAAIRRLQAILAKEPDNADARLELGRALFLAGDTQGAIAETRRILDRDADHAEALFNLGAIYANLGDAAQATHYWNRLLAASPQADVAQTAKKMMLQLRDEPQNGGGNFGGRAGRRS